MILEDHIVHFGQVLTRKEAAAFLGVCLTTLDRLDIPRTMIGRRPKYMRDSIIKWLTDQTEETEGVPNV